jgi:hypothetical protein
MNYECHCTKCEIEGMEEKHCCKAIDDPKAFIRCVSFIDNSNWFNLIWVDGSSLMVKYCPFCGKKAEKKMCDKELKRFKQEMDIISSKPL